MQQSCRWMELGLSIWCLGEQCCKDCVTSLRQQFHLFVNSTEAHPATCGRTTQGKSVTSIREGGEAYFKTSGLPHNEFWPFLGSPSLLQDVRVLPHPKFWSILGRSPLFQLSEALFWPKRRPKILNFYPTRNFGHFWAALSKMSLNYSKFWGRLRRHTQCPLSLVSSETNNKERHCGQTAGDVFTKTRLMPVWVFRCLGCFGV